ncbi:unnamed protein product [Periconia digitata]|uniref:Uncharacterized protein n=1 Tax=Periconia digitata TaxID=1303443 RepID=A0A9W4U8U9_9PLEO|nr:unnamed protein product [Periconia digitata]
MATYLAWFSNTITCKMAIRPRRDLGAVIGLGMTCILLSAISHQRVSTYRFFDMGTMKHF